MVMVRLGSGPSHKLAESLLRSIGPDTRTAGWHSEWYVGRGHVVTSVSGLASIIVRQAQCCAPPNVADSVRSVVLTVCRSLPVFTR